jgi:hypothetical protein
LLQKQGLPHIVLAESAAAPAFCRFGVFSGTLVRKLDFYGNL